MKKICLIIFLLLSIAIKAQNYGTDVEGYSTIYTPGITLGLDVVNNQLDFNYFDVVRKKGGINRANFYGIRLLGDANDGIANIVSSGKVNAGVNLDVVYGYKRFRTKNKNQVLIKAKEKQKNLLIALKTPDANGFKQLIEDIKKAAIIKFINDLRSSYQGIDPVVAVNIKSSIGNKKWEDAKRELKSLDNYFGKMVLTEIEFFDDLRFKTGAKGHVFLENKNVRGGIIEKLDENIRVTSLPNWSNDKRNLKRFEASIKQARNQYDSITQQIAKLKTRSESSINQKFLMKMGFFKQEFKYDLNNGAPTSSERLKNQEFTGLSFDIIYNIQWRHNYFMGFSLRGQRANNFSSLEIKEITFGEAGTENSETLNAYAGPYDTFNRYSVNSDFMWINKLKKEGIYLIVNPYLRHFIYEGADQLKNNTNIGLGLNLFNSSGSKILGGAFIQANDVFGVNTKQSLGKSIAFGITVKVAFEGFDFIEKPKS
ncbi:hypothetical protein [Tenacibaculum xiamenense]|uniref:hypothetical protein n=1 Tax=Tenacibaculum xiamenense TaxID=1261553 RepID=UPI0038937BBA